MLHARQTARSAPQDENGATGVQRQRDSLSLRLFKPDRSVSCPYCGNNAVLVDSKEVYQKSYGLIWLCRPCRAWVGVHRNSRDARPLGRLANAELRKWKQWAHARFDPLWRTRQMTRKAAYALLAKIMRPVGGKEHIGDMNIAECAYLVQYLRTHHLHHSSCWYDNV